MSFGVPYPYGATAPPRQTAMAPTAAPPCGGCMNKAGELAAKNEQINTLKAEIAEKNEQITDLQAALADAPPTDREMAELRERMHLNARQEQEQRRRADQLERELASERRTNENFRIRFERLGMTP